MRITMVLAKWVTLAASIFLLGCSICINGQGIGCGGSPPITLDQAREQHEAQDRQAFERVSNSFLLKLVHARPADPNAGEFDPPTDEQRIQLEKMLDAMIRPIHQRARFHHRSAEFQAHFNLKDSLAYPRVKVVNRGTSPTAKCDINTVEVPVRMLRGILNHSVEEEARGNLKTPLIPKGPFYPGSISRTISSSSAVQFANSAALVNTVAYRATLFAMAHESAHLWSRNCQVSNDSIQQRKNEALADLLATIVASEIYSKSCLKSPLVVSEKSLSQIYLNEEVKENSLGQLISGRMTNMDMNRFLIGGEGDVKILFDSVGESQEDSAEGSHPFTSNRVSVDTRVRRVIVGQFYDDLNSEVNSSLLIRLLIPKEERNLTYEALKIGFAGVDYREFISDDLMVCSAATLRSTVRGAPP